MRCKPRSLISSPRVWKVCPWGNSFLATAFSLSLFRSQLAFSRGEGDRAHHSPAGETPGPHCEEPRAAFTLLFAASVDCSPKGRAFSRFYLTSALRCVPYMLPWAAYSADHQPHNSCCVQYGGLCTCSLALLLPLPQCLWLPGLALEAADSFAC